MRKNHLLTAALFVAALTSCSQDEQLSLTNEDKSIFTGSMEITGSRTELEDNKVKWKGDETISIFEMDNVNAQYKVSGAVENGIATFEFVDFIKPEQVVTLGSNYAVYPYHQANTIDADGNISAPVSAEYTFTDRASSIETALMVAKTDENHFNFTNAQGIICLRLNAQQPYKWGAIQSITLTSKANLLSGTAKMTWNNENEAPIAVIQEGGGKELTINLSDGNKKELPASQDKEYTEFYVPVVPTLFEADDLTLTIEFANSKTYNVTIDKTFEVERKEIQTLKHTIGASSNFDGVIEENIISEDTWDGTSNTSWYNDTDTEFIIFTAEQLAGLAELVDGGNNFAGKTIKLGNNLNLYYLADGATEPTSFDPIGDKSAFAGTFDGDGKTIKNLYQSGWAFGYDWDHYGSVGLFGELESATVKNLVIEGTESLVEGGDVSFVAGSATGTCVFENITIKDGVSATYNNGNGGIIGWSGAGNYTFKNITIEEDVVLAGLWGSFDSSIGGIVGQAEPGATYNFENVEINCRLDVYNDCTASYDYYNYRMCGMIIGRCAKTTTIDGVNYPDMSQYNVTCKNVTVNYGEWMNYHYCEPTPGLNGGRGMRVEPGYSYGGLPEDYDHSQCVDNHMNLIPFDQLIGGDQLGVKGLKTYEGVTVVYPN